MYSTHWCSTSSNQNIYINYLEFFCESLVPIPFTYFLLVQSFIQYRLINIDFILGIIIQFKTICSVAQVVPAFSHWELFQLMPVSIPPLCGICLFMSNFLLYSTAKCSRNIL